jgi:hypothetical protein
MTKGPRTLASTPNVYCICIRLLTKLLKKRRTSPLLKTQHVFNFLSCLAKHARLASRSACSGSAAVQSSDVCSKLTGCPSTGRGCARGGKRSPPQRGRCVGRTLCTTPPTSRRSRFKASRPVVGRSQLRGRACRRECQRESHRESHRESRRTRSLFCSSEKCPSFACCEESPSRSLLIRLCLCLCSRTGCGRVAGVAAAASQQATAQALPAACLPASHCCLRPAFGKRRRPPPPGAAVDAGNSGLLGRMGRRRCFTPPDRVVWAAAGRGATRAGTRALLL